MTLTPLPPPGPDGPLIGELFAGYGGLGMGVTAVLGGTVTWVSDVCKFDKDGNAGHYSPHRGPCAILAARFPDVPNLGDVTKVDWSTVRRVHVLTGGSPCQDLSHAGRRAGMTEGTRSNLWVAMREAIHVLRPPVVVWENVRGALTAEADSELVTDPRLLADLRRRDGEPVLRAAGRVVGDLSELGYDCRWHSVRASDVGAPHGRFRVFIVATDSACDPWWERHGDGGAAADAGGEARVVRPGLREGDAGGDGGGLAARGGGEDDAAVELLGTPTARMWKGSGQPGSASHTWLLDHGNVEAQVLSLPDTDRLLPTPTAQPEAMGNPEARAERVERAREKHGRPFGSSLSAALGPLLPTPAVNDMGASYTPEEWDAWTDRMKAEHGNGNGHGNSLAIEAQRLLPTPCAEDANGSGGAGSRGEGRQAMLHDTAKRLLPTPQAHDAKGAKTPEQVAAMRADGHGVANLNEVAAHELAGDLMLPSAVQPDRLLPTPRVAADRTGRGALTRDGHWSAPALGQAVELADGVLPREYESWDEVQGNQPTSWGDYAPVIARWETVIGRPAPPPTQPSKKGNPQLAAPFVEFMMGLPPGWVTDVQISRNDQLKALGNGVVPQQAAYAVALMLTWRLPS